MRYTILIFLFTSYSSFGQGYNPMVSDLKVGDFIAWEINNSKDTTSYFDGFGNKLPYYTKSIDWRNLLVIYEPDRETAFEALFKELLSDSILNLDKQEIEKQYEQSKKGLPFDFIKKINGVKWTNEIRKHRPTINYSVPISNSKNDLMIICKDYALNNGNGKIRGEYYIKVYLRSDDKWKLYKSMAHGY